MFKVVIVALCAAAVAAAHAVVFNVVSVGTWLITDSGYTTSEGVVFQNTPSAVTHMDWTATYVGSGAQGTILYSGAGGTVTLSFTSGPFSGSGDGSATALSGVWNYVSGTGDYANYVGGTGTFGSTYNINDNYSSTTLSGHLDPVPEPASLAALGVGALVLIRRRRNR